MRNLRCLKEVSSLLKEISSYNALNIKKKSPANETLAEIFSYCEYNKVPGPHQQFSLALRGGNYDKIQYSWRNLSRGCIPAFFVSGLA